MHLRTSIKTFITDENGATAIEYALIASLISVFIITALKFFGAEITSMYTFVSSSISSAIGDSGGD